MPDGCLPLLTCFSLNGKTWQSTSFPLFASAILSTSFAALCTGETKVPILGSLSLALLALRRCQRHLQRTIDRNIRSLLAKDAPTPTQAFQAKVGTPVKHIACRWGGRRNQTVALVVGRGLGESRLGISIISKPAGLSPQVISLLDSA